MDDWSKAEDTVEILEAHPTGERVHHVAGELKAASGEPPKPLPPAHRTTNLPRRSRGGAITETALILDGQEIPWGDIQLFAVGAIHHSLGDLDGPKGVMRQMFGKVMGRDDKADKKNPRVQEFIFLDLMIKGSDAPHRLESGSINYRNFLDYDVTFISFHNFYRLVVRLARMATQARVTDSAQMFLNRRRDQMKRFAAIYDFEMDTNHQMQRFGTLTPMSEIDLSRDNWADDWDDYEE